MIELSLIPREMFRTVLDARLPEAARLALYADMCRANALVAVKRAGSGHIGSSFSAMDIVVHLYLRVMNTLKVGVGHPDRDIYFSSKGHDVPGLYAALFAFGVLPEEKLLKLRRLGGLDGHPDIHIPGIEANSGSLGMGISKGRGMAWAKAYLGRAGRVFVLTGDGEWQEGQNFEALQGAACRATGNLTVIMDHNKVQSDKPVGEIVPLGELETKFRSFGWHVTRCDGHDHEALGAAFLELDRIRDRPRMLIADTIKGRGVSFMEHPEALREGGGYYRWHSGAPSDERYAAAWGELTTRIGEAFARLGLGGLATAPVAPETAAAPAAALKGEPDSVGAAKPSLKATAEFVAEAYGRTLLEIGARRKDVVVLDADLSADCRVRQFELAHPERFIECGIAEQDMVSMAGGLARQGLIPVVNSFASFLASRSNEQIYNNATERTKIVYVCHYAGLIPAGPGKSHQSIRDISLFGALPNCEILQPCNAEETRQVVTYAVEQSPEACMIRLVIGPSPHPIALPEGYRLERGRGVVLAEGRDAVVFAYGPVMLNEALAASERLAARNIGLQVVNMPWLNRVDADWLAGAVAPFRRVFVLEDHAPEGGLGDTLLNALSTAGLLGERTLNKWAVEGYPACGTPAEALRFHRLDSASLAERVSICLGQDTVGSP